MAHYNLYHYDPNIPLAILALVIFSLFAVIVSYQAYRYKSWYMYGVAGGAAGEAVGFAIRLWSGQPKNTGNIGAFAASTLFLLLPPIVIALGSYLAVAKIIACSNHRTKYIQPALVEKVFVSVDVIGFLVQASGGGMMAIQSLSDVGSNIALIGLSFAMLSLVVFTIITYYVQHSPNFTFQTSKDTSQKPSHWRILYWPIWVNIAALLIRSIYRIAEFAQGYNGYLISHEVYSYVFDPLMIFIAILASIILPPRRHLQQ
ncbi:RTA1 like protein, partial [Basidiobolus ranarum]